METRPGYAIAWKMTPGQAFGKTHVLTSFVAQGADPVGKRTLCGLTVPVAVDYADDSEFCGRCANIEDAKGAARRRNRGW